MAYRPTNDIKENAIHRNTIFESQSLVSCCTCGYCIEKTEDASLTITNFKAAESFNDALGPVAGPVREFSNYMMPSGSFGPYILYPYKLQYAADSLSSSQEKYADQLVYYPFLKCNGSISGVQYGSFPATAVTIGSAGITHPIKYYGSEFGMASSAVLGTATFLSNEASINNANIGSSGAADKIGYDPQFGSYAYQSYNTSGYQGTNKFTYSNTKITDTAFIPSFCATPLPADNNATHLSGCYSYYKWSQYRQKEEGVPFLDWYYFGIYDPSGNLYYNWYYWWWWNTSYLPVNINLKFSSDLTWSLLGLLESGPTENFARANYYTNMYSLFNFNYPINLFLQYNTFLDVSTGNGLQFYCNDPLCTSGVNLRAWVSAGPRIRPFPANPSIWVEPCTSEQLDYIAEHGYAGYYNSIAYPFANRTVPPKPADIDIGNYQPYLDYIASHDYSDISFRSNSGCTNNITKIMEPVFYKNFDDYSFPYLYDGFNELFTDYYITDQILAPNFTKCDVEYNRLPNPDPNLPNPNPWIPTYPTVEAKTYKIKSLGNTYQILKDGYVLDRFELNKDGSFYATMSIVKENSFLAVSGTRRWEVGSEQLVPYVGNMSPTYDLQNYCSALFNQWFNIPVDDTTTLHASSKFVYSSAFQVQEYQDQTMAGYYVNGLFSNYYLSSPLMYHSDICRGYFGYSPQFACPTSYVGQKSSRTQITSSTDSSGRTTVFIRNVLWIGKQLLKKTYSTDDGSSSYGKVTSIIPVSIGSGYKNTTTVSITAPTNRSKLPLPVFTAKATPIITNGSITGYNITDPGSGYDPSNPPSVSFSYTGSGASAKVIVSPQPDVLANGSAVPSYYEASLYGGFESDIEVSFQSTPMCKTKDIPDKFRKVTRLKIKFEDYRKIPQSDFIMEGKASILVEATPEIYSESVGAYSGFLRPFSNPSIYYVPNNTFDNVAFIEPNVNKDSTSVFYNKVFQSYENPFVKDIVEIDPPVSTSYVSKVGRAYPDFGVPDRFKSCLLVNGNEDVWKTGNEVKFVGLFFKVTNGGSGYTAIPTVTLSGGGGTGAKAKATINGGRVTSVYLEYYGVNYTSNMNVLITGGGGTGATAVDITFTPFYSIYMEEIKNEKQTAGQTLIRIASTLQNALNGIYIPNVGLETLYKGRDLEVKFLNKYKDVSLENTVGFLNLNPNEADFSNEKASSSGASYRQEGTFQTSFTSQLKFRYLNNPSYSESGVGEFFALSIGNYQLRPYFSKNNQDISPIGCDRIEIISLSPLIIKYVGVAFVHNSSTPKYIVTSYTPPGIPTITTESTHARQVGFKCDIILEEVVDEFIQEALPVEFNQILENVEFIQTSNLMNSRTPMQMVNPEKCEHIGKVIDRKDCNCPKKWIRLCDVHGKTDWKNCMQCKDFKVSE